MNITILNFESLESTNSEALEQAKRGADEGLCVVARQQTEGRGRHGREWVSEKDARLYFSIVLRPKIASEFLPLITLMSAVAVSDVLVELYRLTPDIKWPNDVLVNGKKISGILAEAIATPKGLAIIVGIGINLNSSNFPPEFSENATSIKHETDTSPDVKVLLSSLIKFLTYFYNILQDPDGARSIRADWAKRSSYFIEKNVRVVTENSTIEGVTDGIEKNGALRIITNDGEIETIHAGDVETLRENRANN